MAPASCCRGGEKAELAYEAKLLKSFSRFETRKLGQALVLGGSMVMVTFFLMLGPSVIPFNRFEGIFINGEKGEGDPSSNHTFDSCDQNNGGNNTLSCINNTTTNLLFAFAGTKTMATDPSNQKPICDFSDKRSDICDLSGGTIKILKNSSSIIFSPSNPSHQQHSWTIKPHPRKGDQIALAHVTEITIKSSPNQNQSPPCSTNHTIPSILFSTGGYMGNLFHDFTDILIPLFITATTFQTQVHFIIINVQPWWLAKYKPFLHHLSSHQIIKFDEIENVPCFPRVIVGLRKHKEMWIDSSISPNAITLSDFAATMRKSYGLGRHEATKLNQGKKPRLLIIARKFTRSFMNINEIVKMAEELGFEAVVAEAEVSSNLYKFAQVVNSCDVMMGVHGAGLTNLVFLPANAVVIQIVPLGGLEDIAWIDFGRPAMEMKMRYLQYGIGEEESSLVEEFDREGPVFRDPGSIQRQGWMALRKIYLDRQNVRIDVKRFRSVLVQAFQFLH